MDTIIVRDLLLEARIGVPEEERANPQNVLVSFEIDLDLTAAGRSDDLSDTLDYGALISGVEALVGEGEVRLIEHLAERVAGYLLDLRGVESVTVEIAKETPPVPQTVGKVAMIVKRQR